MAALYRPQQLIAQQFTLVLAYRGRNRRGFPWPSLHASRCCIRRRSFLPTMKSTAAFAFTLALRARSLLKTPMLVGIQLLHAGSTAWKAAR
jgi:hypothetical protein